MSCRRQRPFDAERVSNLRRHIREHWGKIPVQEIADMMVGETYSTVAKYAAAMGMPRLGTSAGSLKGSAARAASRIPAKGIPAATLKWARGCANVNREAAMILALTGEDVRGLGWR